MSALLAVVPTLASAQAWSGGSITSNNWSDNLNWEDFDEPSSTPGLTSNVNFLGTPARTSPFINGAYYVEQLHFTKLAIFGTSSSFTLNGTGFIKLYEAVVNSTSKVQIINTSLILGDDVSFANFRDGTDYGYLGFNAIDANGKKLTVNPSTQGISLGGDITGGGELVVNGPGTVTVGGRNSFDEGITIYRGTLNYSGGPALGSLDNYIYFSPTTGSTATLRRYTSGTTSLGMYFSPGESHLAVANGETVTYSGEFSGNGNITKTEPGTLKLTGQLNHQLGRFSVSEGSLWMDGEALIPDQPLTISAGASLMYADGKIDRIESLSGGGNLALGEGTDLTVGFYNFPSLATNFGGQISGTGCAFTKDGPSILNLTGFNAYSGTTRVSQGTLLVNNIGTNTSATGTSNVTVQNTATLGGDGRIAGDVTLNPGAHLSPSSTSFVAPEIGSLTVGALIASIHSRVHIELATNTHDSVYGENVIILDGTLTLSALPGQSLSLGSQRNILHASTALVGKFRSIEGVQLSASQALAITYGLRDVYVTIAKPGDATLDGSVNFDDLLRLAQHYNTTAAGKVWIDGDFDGTGIVNFDDLLTLAQNYGSSGFAVGDLDELGATFAADWALARSLAPEPASLGLLIFTTTALRRSRSCRSSIVAE